VKTPAAADVALVVVVHNRALDVPWVLGRVPAGWQAIVVDRGSTDGSPELAAALGAVVVQQAKATINDALAVSSADVVAWVAPDRSVDPRDLRPHVAAVLAGDVDAVLATRGRATLLERARRRRHAIAGAARREHAAEPEGAPRIATLEVPAPTAP
jgi:hypothetical protein